MDQEYDLILVSVPKMDLASPYVGPALLKAVCAEAGFKVKCIDLNIKLYHFIGESYKGLWLEDSPAFNSDKFDLYEKQLFPEFIFNWARKLIDMEARYIGVSCITYADREFSYRLIREIKRQNALQKILIGGTDAENRFHHFKSEKIIDYYIPGDAEEPLVKLLGGESLDHSLSLQQNKNIGLQPFPDYSDVDFSKYSFDFYDCIQNSPLATQKYTDQRMVYITSSRGCIRKCTFCDISHYWKKYVYKSGEVIADEMYHQYNKHKIRYFYFTDSLINGNVQNLIKMCNRLIQLQKETGVVLYWRAQFIVMPSNLHQEEFYELLKEAGCDLLIVGVESGSEEVRKEMKKKFTNEDLYDFLGHCEKVGIKTGLLFLVGFPTETEVDFELTLKMLEKMKSYRKINYISIGHTLQIAMTTPLFLDSKKYQITYDYFDSWKNPNSTLSLRIERLLELKKSALSFWFKLREPRTGYLKQQLESQQLYTKKISSKYLELFEGLKTQISLRLNSNVTTTMKLNLFFLHQALMKKISDNSKVEGFFFGEPNENFKTLFSRSTELSLAFLAKEMKEVDEVGERNEVNQYSNIIEKLSGSDAYRILFYLKSPELFRIMFADIYKVEKSNLFQSTLLFCAGFFENSNNFYWIDFYERKFKSWKEEIPDSTYVIIHQTIEGILIGEHSKTI